MSENEASKKSVKLVKLSGLEDNCPIPIYLAVGDGEDVDLRQIKDNLAYVIAGNAVMLYRDSGVFKSLTDHDGIQGFAEIDRKLLISVNPIPKELVSQILGFFRWAEKERRTEAIVLPYYNKETGEWKIICPKQKATYAHVDYEPPKPGEIPNGFVRIGSWHSHGDMDAYHSTVDTTDEKFDDGIHLTSGHIDTEKPSVVSSGVMYGIRWSINPAIMVDYPLESVEVPATIKGSKWNKTAEPAYTKYMTPTENRAPIPFPEEWKDQHIKGVVLNAHKTYSPSYSPCATKQPEKRCTNCAFNVFQSSLQEVLLIEEELSKNRDKHHSYWEILKKLRVNKKSGLPKITSHNAKILEELKDYTDNLDVLVGSRRYLTFTQLSTLARFTKKPTMLRSFKEKEENKNTNLLQQHNLCTNTRVKRYYVSYQDSCSRFERKFTTLLAFDNKAEELELEEEFENARKSASEAEEQEKTCFDCDLLWDLDCVRYPKVEMDEIASAQDDTTAKDCKDFENKQGSGFYLS